MQTSIDLRIHSQTITLGLPGKEGFLKLNPGYVALFESWQGGCVLIDEKY